MLLTRLGSRAVAGMAACALILLAGPASATTFRCQAGDVTCLIESIRAANTNGRVKNTIRLDAGTYTLQDIDNVTDGANGLPSIMSTLVIDVAGTGVVSLERATTAARFRIIHVGAGGDLTLRHAAVANGMPSTGCGGGVYNTGIVNIANSSFSSNDEAGLCNRGGTATITDSRFLDNHGAIDNRGTLTIRRTLVRHNFSTGPGGLQSSAGIVTIRLTIFDDNDGALDAGSIGIYGGAALIRRTSLSNSAAQGAGALFVAESATVSIRNSALIANSGTTGGGAILNRGTLEVTNTTIAINIADGIFGSSLTAIANDGTMTLTNVTLAGNRPTPRPSSAAVIGTSASGTTTVRNTIFGHVADEFVQECQGTLISRGNNIFGNLAGCGVTVQASDIVGDARLDVFTDDGAAGDQHFGLLPDSPAIGGGRRCPKNDQNGQLRVDRCDIGAVIFRALQAPTEGGEGSSAR